MMSDTLVSHCLADLAYPDIQAYLSRDDIVLIPLGSCEQHGAHLPLCTDTVTALEVARRAAEAADVLYTPALWCGYSPQHLREPGAGIGTISLRPATVEAMLYDVCRSLIHHGFNKIVIVSGHGSHAKIIDPVLRRIRNDTGAFIAFYKPYAERYIGLLGDLLENPPEETPGWHASELETSQMLAYEGGRLVRMDRAVNTRAGKPVWLPESFIKKDGAPDVEFRGYQYFAFPLDHDEWTPSGVIGNPFRATAEKGEEALRRFSDYLVDAILEFRTVPIQAHSRAWLDKV
jgi:creatinine amidohydrolase